MNNIHEVFENQVEKTPYATAIIDDYTSITYQELNEKANQLAHYLRSLGIKPDMKIALCFERSFDMFIAVLAILKAGAAYVPLDNSHPEERLLFCLNDNDNPILILSINCQEKFKAYAGHCLYLDIEREIIATQKTSNPVRVTLPHHLAYVIYTSGSTGKPKGVLIEHQSALNYFNWVINYCDYEPGKRVDFSANFIFDMAITTTIIPLMHGLTIVIASNDIKKTASAYLHHLAEKKINLIKITPSYFKLLVHEVKNHVLPLPYLETIILGGENLNRIECADWLHLYPHHVLHNEYGPTEVTVAVSQYTVDHKNISLLGINVPIGLPGPNMGWYILDENYQPVPDGVAGELYICGSGLARGYLNQQALTQQKFIHLSFYQGRLYQTGDICRQNADGNVEYLGRVDSQIKIRGFRIEIQEIEERLLAHPDIDDARIVVEEQEKEKRLLAYLILKAPDHLLKQAEIRQHLLSHLPEHMVPAIFIKVNHFPLTANGKLDTKALPPPCRSNDKAYKAPTTRLEKKLAALWERELQIKSIGLRDDFFELGGHSLAAARIISDIQYSLGKKISLSTFYQARTLAELSKLTRKSENVVKTKKITEPSKHDSPLIPLGHFQFMLWMARTFERKASNLNIITRRRMQGQIDLQQLESAFTAVLKKHELFFYRILKLRPAQIVQKELAFKFSKRDLTALSQKESELVLQNSTQELVDFQNWQINRPLLKARLFYLSNQSIEIQLCMPHIITDDLSPEILVTELSNYYQHPQPVETSDKGYKECILAEHEHAKKHLETHINFWDNYLKDASLFVMPTTLIANNMIGKGLPYSTYMAIPPHQLNQLKNYCAYYHLSLNQGLCAALLLALSRSCQNVQENKSIVLNRVKSTRDNPRYDNSIGCFLRIEPLKINLNRSNTLLSLAQELQQAELETAPYQECSNLLKLACVKTFRQSSKLKSYLLNIFNYISTRLFSSKTNHKLLPLYQRLIAFKRNHHFLINVNLHNNFVFKELQNKTIFGLKPQDIPLYQYDFIKINSVFDVCFFRDNAHNYMVISANVAPEFRQQVGAEMLNCIQIAAESLKENYNENEVEISA